MNVGRASPRLWAAFWNHPISLLIVTTLMWAGHAVVGRMAVGQISPMFLTSARWAIALALILFAARKDLPRDWPILRGRLPYIGAMGALGYTAFNALFYIAAHFTGALNMAILQGAMPAMVLIGAWAVFGARIGALQALGVAATMIGVVAIAAQGEWSRLFRLQFNFGDLIMLVAVVFYSGYTVALRFRPAVSSLGFLAAMAIAAFLSSLPLAAVEFARGEFKPPSWTGIFVLAYATVIASFLSQLFFMRGVELIGPGRAGVFINLVPVFGAVMAVALLGEKFGGYHIIALILVVGGIAAAQKAPK